MTKCWFKNDEGWEIGKVLSWSNYIIPLRQGSHLYPNAIVRCADGSIQGRFATDIRLEEPEEWSKPNQALTKAAEEYTNRPANKSKRFRPCLKRFDRWLAVQVHPEVIELFSESSNENLVYQCQVSWDGSNVMCTRGGIPYHELRSMFKEAECEIAHQEGRARPLREFIDDLQRECDA